MSRIALIIVAITQASTLIASPTVLAADFDDARKRQAAEQMRMMLEQRRELAPNQFFLYSLAVEMTKGDLLKILPPRRISAVYVCDDVGGVAGFDINPELGLAEQLVQVEESRFPEAWTVITGASKPTAPDKSDIRYCGFEAKISTTAAHEISRTLGRGLAYVEVSDTRHRFLPANPRR